MTAGTPPSGEARRLHPATLVQRLLASIPALVVLLLPVLRGADATAWVSLLSAALYGFVVLPLLLLQYHRFRYAVTPKEIVIQRGVVTRQHRSIPIERIQNIEIEQTLLPRLLGTAKVKIETAGSTTTEGVLEYVGLAEAHRLREAVRAYQREQHLPPLSSEGPGAAPPPLPATPAAPAAAPPAPAPLFTMSLGRAVLAGAFRFSLLYIVLIFTAMEYTGVEPQDIVDWFTRGRLKGVTELAAASPLLATAATVLSVLLFAWLTGIAVSVNRYFGFRLWLDGGKLHHRHGLLTLAEGTIPLPKVQALVLRTNPAMRAFGWHALQVQTMGLDTQQRGTQVAVPLGRLDEVLAVARLIRPFELPERFHRVSRRTVRRSTVRYTLRLLAAVLPVAYLWRPALWGLVLAAAIPSLALLQYRRHGYAFADGMLFVRRGVFQPHVWAIPVDRFQVFYRAASFFQRRLGLASLYVDTAGAGSLRYPVVVDLPAGEADACLEAWYRAYQSRYEAPAGHPAGRAGDEVDVPDPSPLP